MPEQKNNIPFYSFADIERYLQGKLSPAEMHEMEKAALQDPFLADAIEGYQQADISDSATDLADIRSQLSSAPALVVPQNARRSKGWRIAAIFILLAGMGMAGWKFLLQPTGKTETLAMTRAVAVQKNMAGSGSDSNPVTNQAPLQNNFAENKRHAQSLTARIAEKPTAAVSQENYANSRIAKEEDLAQHDSILASISAAAAKDKEAREINTRSMAAAPNNIVVAGTGQKNVTANAKILAYSGQDIHVDDRLSGVSAQKPVTVSSLNPGKKKNMDTILIDRADLLDFAAKYIKSNEKNISPDTSETTTLAAMRTNAKQGYLSIDSTPLAGLTNRKLNVTFTVDSTPPKPSAKPAVTFGGASNRAPFSDLATAGNYKLKKEIRPVSSAPPLMEQRISDTVSLIKPRIGWSAFSNYLREKLSGSNTITFASAGKDRVVRIKITVDENGKASNARVLETFDGKLNRILIKAIEEGPLWMGNEKQIKDIVFSVTL